MKKHPLAITCVCAALAIAAGLSFLPLHAQDAGKVKRSGKIEMQIDPSQPGFSFEQTEKNIRNAAKPMGLDAAQQKQLDDAIDQLRDSMSQLKEGGAFNWKWEYNADTPAPSRPKAGPAPRLRDRAPAQPIEPGNPRDLLRKLFEQGDGFGGKAPDPEKLLQEMMRQMGGMFEEMDPRAPGQREQPFRFRLDPPNGNPKNAENNDPLQGLKRLLGQRDRNYDPDTAPRDSKYSRATLAEYRSCVKDARKMTVSVLREGKQVALGAVVTADGYVISKSSELGKSAIECEFMDGKIVPAKVVHRLENYDLALLKLDGDGFTPVVWKEDALPIGTMLAASGIDEDPISVGVLSVLARNLDDGQKGFAGLGLDESKDGSGVTVRMIVPDGPASKSGLEVGDVILSIDGKYVNRPQELMREIAAKGPGDEIAFKVKTTTDESTTVKITLSSRQEFKRMLTQGVDPTAQMGSDLSNRPDGFPDALQNDLGINANQCGGPVVDIEGNVVGLNIARSGRTSTYMLSARTVKAILADVSNGKLTMVKDNTALDKDLKRAEAALKAAQDALKAAQEAKNKAR